VVLPYIVIHGNPGFSRWDACRGSGILPGIPDPVIRLMNVEK
jgi:hypothetical protein